MAAGSATRRERTCVGCGSKGEKARLYRIVRGTDGSVRFDAKGNAAGRGAYVCSRECFDKALSGGKLQRALRVSLNPEDAHKAGIDISAACAVEE